MLETASAVSHKRRPFSRWAVKLIAGLAFFSWQVAYLCCGQDPAEVKWERLTSDGQLKLRPTWSPDGSQLLFARVGSDSIRLVLRNLNSGVEQPLTQETHPQLDGVFSPDGKWIALTHNAASANQGNMDLWLWDVAAAKSSLLIGDAGKLSHEEYPSWAPDSNKLVFSSTRDGNQELYSIHRDGSQLKRLTSHPGIDAHPAWSPDGAWISWATDRWGNLEIALMTPDGESVQRLTENAGADDNPAWSPTGEFLAWTSLQDEQHEIYVMRLADRQVANASRHPAVDFYPAWLPDGRLSFVSQRDGTWDVYVGDVTVLFKNLPRSSNR